MLSKNLKLKGICLIKNQKFKDKRGFFFESFNKKKISKTFFKRKLMFVKLITRYQKSM